MDNQNQTKQKIIWWKDKKLLAGVILVVLSFGLGFYGKGLLIVKFYEPVYLITGLSIWAFSWVVMLIGVFLVGWETVRMIQMRIHHHVKKTVKETYHYTKELPEKGYRYTKKLQREGMSKIAKTSRVIIKKIRR